MPRKPTGRPPGRPRKDGQPAGFGSNWKPSPNAATPPKKRGVTGRFPLEPEEEAEDVQQAVPVEPSHTARTRSHARDAAYGLPGLTEPQIQALALWLLGKSIRYIARRCKRSPATIAIWRDSPEWQEAERIATARLWSTYGRRATALIGQALTVSEEVMEGKRQGDKRDWLQVQLLSAFVSQAQGRGGQDSGDISALAPPDPDDLPADALTVERLDTPPLPALPAPPTLVEHVPATETLVTVAEVPAAARDATPPDEVDPLDELRSSPWEEEEEEAEGGDGWRSWR